jgi:hypothetical protein
MKLATQIALLFMALSFPAQAHDIEQGTSVFCATQKQVERVVSLLDDNIRPAINTVNAEEHDPHACFVATVAYVRGAQIDIARNRLAAFQIVEILVGGVGTNSGFRNLAPAIYFSIFKIDERST